MHPSCLRVTRIFFLFLAFEFQKSRKMVLEFLLTQRMAVSPAASYAWIFFHAVQTDAVYLTENKKDTPKVFSFKFLFGKEEMNVSD